MTDIASIMQMGPVIPVLVINDSATARPIAEALVSGGLRVLEVTLRTPAALDAIAVMREVDGAVVGAGTVLNKGQLADAKSAGSEFIVSPGLTQNLANAAIDDGIPFLPGIATASDIMRGMEMGLKHFKFFPAEASGGLGALKALASPFREARFCPTGGIRQETASQWLDHPSVLCVGGSWLVSAQGPQDYAAITQRAKAASKLMRN